MAKRATRFKQDQCFAARTTEDYQGVQKATRFKQDHLFAQRTTEDRRRGQKNDEV